MVTQNSWNSEDPVQVQKGGSGLSNLTNHNLLIGNDQQPIVLLPPDPTEGIPIVSNGSTSDPSYGTAFIEGGGTGATSFTPFSTITAGGTATSPLNPVSPGNTGDVLTSNGPGAFPSYQPGGGPGTGGSLIWLDTQTANDSIQLSWNSTFINTSFNIHFLILDNLVPIEGFGTLKLQVSTDNGATWLVTGYDTSVKNLALSFSTITNDNSFHLAGGNDDRVGGDPNWGYTGDVTIYNLSSGGIVRTNSKGSYRRSLDNEVEVALQAGFAPPSITINAIRLIFESGNIESGTVHLYGVRTS